MPESSPETSTNGPEPSSTKDDDVEDVDSTRVPKARYSDSHDDKDAGTRRNGGDASGDALVPGPARAIFGYDSDSVCELAFAEGQLLEVLEVHEDGWCLARTDHGAKGMVSVGAGREQQAGVDGWPEQVPCSYIKMEPSAEFRVTSPHWEEAPDDSEFTATGSLKKVSKKNGAENSLSLSHCHDSLSSMEVEEQDEAAVEQSAARPSSDADEAASKAPRGDRDTTGAASIKSAPRFCGTGPNGDWEHVQVSFVVEDAAVELTGVIKVITPDMANRLVLNRGAVFSKYSYKKGMVGVKQKSDRIVWLSGDNKIMWQDPSSKSVLTSNILTGGNASPSTRQPGFIVVGEIISISRTAPHHYGVDNELSIYIVTTHRSLLLEAPNSEEREFWFSELSKIVETAKAEQRERRRQEKCLEKDFSMTERRRQWMQDILPNFEKMRETKQCRALCWLGVPTNLRVEVWRKCIGNQLQITKELYDIFRSHAQRARRDLEKSLEIAMNDPNNQHALLGSESSLKDKSFWKLRRGDGGSGREISYEEEEDSWGERSFGWRAGGPDEGGFFHQGGPLEAQLRDVLEAYIFYRPDVGYVQGMSYLAAMLLLTMDTYQAFVALTNLLHSHYFLSFFAMDMLQATVYLQIRIRFSVFEHFFERLLPDLFETFQELGVTTDFSLPLPLFSLLSPRSGIWDNYLLNGESFMIRAALGVLKWLSAQLVDMPFEDLMVTLTHLHNQVDIEEEELFDAIASIKVRPPALPPLPHSRPCRSPRKSSPLCSRPRR
ncbi:hypothetical protein GUITHDRAFT_135591 [Guillardia theta CCMP2712]|uniref:Rab-GAP TBC domain-containing protein n=1 Tax=Guillardia theta (strain CCMP2712) TaxID=905079 RepID=L1JN84_GUITC|nr:hypothetical protein GUITHDRAFT_135591 [Guillardia theta CCMP2712]EKX49897.1 hypothetical protein GUITHDRAFT_135591 [Guillardia theta CCMP2712]|eukprot:XP_005836877.1 hypothetical protein GUITHDRAFT_135591 [Guillardia theta CCMP2712]